jgi:hypothetical protein
LRHLAALLIAERGSDRLILRRRLGAQLLQLRLGLQPPLSLHARLGARCGGRLLGVALSLVGNPRLAMGLSLGARRCVARSAQLLGQDGIPAAVRRGALLVHSRLV